MMARAKTSQKTTSYYATGRRKTAIARVWLMPGKGNISINSRPIEQYFGRKIMELQVRKPLELVKLQDKFDVIAKSVGGGIAGQAGAIRHGISRALVIFDETLRSPLKKDGLLTRDPREKERKKYGRKRARKGFQWTKR
ncbi:MAG: 30S ribosomal protein S9 [Candidatus Eremiobacteraeota bacterium]|nr:30S ribosomal protein S9 [Candidatus Eremiobacteraeota bacterium]